MLRPYQQDAVDAILSHISHALDPCAIEAATGAGKSHIVAEIAHAIKNKAGKKVLCLAPSKELLEQNHGKYCAIEPASLYSASAGQKSLRHDVVFGTPGTVKNNLARFKDFAAVVIDEAHGITPTIKGIVAAMRESNPKLRVIGMTATPYRTDTGYIYQVDENGKTVHETQTRDPFFYQLLYKITAPELIAQGYLTPPTTEIHSGYDTSHLEKDQTGRWSSESLEMVFEGHGRKTAHIVAEVVELSVNRRGVMFFAATLAHADEILASLPRENTRLIHGGLAKKDREQYISDFKNQRAKYIVNRDILTTGFDAPHVDVIAILRRTESPGLLQQIIGRGLRLYDAKKDCLVLDYAENFEAHFPHGDIFQPDISAKYAAPSQGGLAVVCPDCNYENDFTARPNPDCFSIAPDGYFVDLAGAKLDTPAHFGRRCQGFYLSVDHTHHQCLYRWMTKECIECGGDNDIAARFCEHCKAELIDPNEKLQIEFKRMKTRPDLISTDRVLHWECKEHISMKGNTTLLIQWTTEYRTFPVYYMPGKKAEWAQLSQAVFGVGKIAPDVGLFLAYLKFGKMPESITCHRPKGQPFFKVFQYGGALDEIPELA